ncbi:TadE/TadG family type IV pilus assembly protein [Streptomyces odontomachi]|uniref:TadE/TadG family type IV pilus assembly protein n=1 Tax=Streptomyces odontomachi TaxID=2944940 RepID=UPI00210BAB12|nr:TadE/TadG family type IV pilus assembly protein [Streptomyces sp. ODS25]
MARRPSTHAIASTHAIGRYRFRFRFGARGRVGKPGRDRGQVAIEYVGLLPILLFVGLCAVQLGLAIYAVQQAGTAARAAARVASQLPHTSANPQAAGDDATSDWLDADVDSPVYGYDSVTVTAHVTIPTVVPGLDFGTAERSVTMPRD